MIKRNSYWLNCNLNFFPAISTVVTFVHFMQCSCVKTWILWQRLNLKLVGLDIYLHSLADTIQVSWLYFKSHQYWWWSGIYYWAFKEYWIMKSELSYQYLRISWSPLLFSIGMSSTFVFIKFAAKNDQFKLYTNILYLFCL